MLCLCSTTSWLFMHICTAARLLLFYLLQKYLYRINLDHLCISILYHVYLVLWSISGSSPGHPGSPLIVDVDLVPDPSWRRGSNCGNYSSLPLDVCPPSCQSTPEKDPCSRAQSWTNPASWSWPSLVAGPDWGRTLVHVARAMDCSSISTIWEFLYCHWTSWLEDQCKESQSSSLPR